MELGKSCGRVWGRVEGPKDDRNSTGTPTVNYSGSQRLNHQPKSTLGLELGHLHIYNRYAAWSFNDWTRGYL